MAAALKSAYMMDHHSPTVLASLVSQVLDHLVLLSTIVQPTTAAVLKIAYGLALGSVIVLATLGLH